MPQLVDQPETRNDRTSEARNDQTPDTLWGAALMRMRKLNCRHATLAVDLRNTADRIGPYAVALLYQAVDAHGLTEVRAATRLFRDAPEVRDLPAMMAALTAAADDELRRIGPFDPRLHLAHRSQQMPADAPFIGVGVSSLDSPYGRWADMARWDRLSAVTMPGRSMVFLYDGTCLILDRGGELGSWGRAMSTVRPEGSLVMFSDVYHLFTPDAENLPTWRAIRDYGMTVNNIHRAYAEQQAERVGQWRLRVPRPRGTGRHGR